MAPTRWSSTARATVRTLRFGRCASAPATVGPISRQRALLGLSLGGARSRRVRGLPCEPLAAQARQGPPGRPRDRHRRGPSPRVVGTIALLAATFGTTVLVAEALGKGPLYRSASRAAPLVAREASSVQVVRRDSDRRVPVRRLKTCCESLGASRARARLYGSAAHDEQTNDEGDDDELEGDACGVLEAALQTGVADGDPYGEGEQPGDHQEPAKPGRDQATHDSRSAQEQEGNREHDPEIALKAP